MRNRYVIYRKPVVVAKPTRRVIGYIVRLSDGTSYYEQRKQVIAGHCVNYGRQWTN